MWPKPEMGPTFRRQPPQFLAGMLHLENKFGYRFISNVSDKDKRVTFRIYNVDSLEKVLNVLSIKNNSAYELDEKLKIIRVSKK